jgi:hypothetical protein
MYYIIIIASTVIISIIKKITNWIYGSTSDQFIAKIKGQKNVELEIVKKDG